VFSAAGCPMLGGKPRDTHWLYNPVSTEQVTEVGSLTKATIELHLLD
jgi:hypothetical protein